MWSMGELQVYEIYCRSQVVEALSNYRNFNCGDLEISLVVIRLGVTGLKKTGLVNHLDLFEGMGERVV